MRCGCLLVGERLLVGETSRPAGSNTVRLRELEPLALPGEYPGRYHLPRRPAPTRWSTRWATRTNSPFSPPRSTPHAGELPSSPDCPLESDEGSHPRTDQSAVDPPLFHRPRTPPLRFRIKGGQGRQAHRTLATRDTTASWCQCATNRPRDCGPVWMGRNRVCMRRCVAHRCGDCSGWPHECPRDPVPARLSDSGAGVLRNP